MDFWVKILSDIYNNSGEYVVNQKEPSLISFFLTHQLDGYFSTLYIDECTYRYISLNTIVFCEWIIFHSSSKKRQTIEDPQQCGGFKICSNTSLMNQGLRKKCQAKPWKNRSFLNESFNFRVELSMQAVSISLRVCRILAGWFSES